MTIRAQTGYGPNDLRALTATQLAAHPPQPLPAAVDDPVWVRARYEDAKALLLDIREAARTGETTLDPSLWEEVEAFYAATFMDRCTTLGSDCGCNSTPILLPATATEREHIGARNGAAATVDEKCGTQAPCPPPATGRTP